MTGVERPAEWLSIALRGNHTMTDDGLNNTHNLEGRVRDDYTVAPDEFTKVVKHSPPYSRANAIPIEHRMILDRKRAPNGLLYRPIMCERCGAYAGDDGILLGYFRRPCRTCKWPLEVEFNRIGEEQLLLEEMAQNRGDGWHPVPGFPDFEFTPGLNPPMLRHRTGRKTTSMEEMVIGGALKSGMIQYTGG